MELKRCPFCDGPVHRKVEHSVDGCFHIGMPHCPVLSHRMMTVEQWNTRPTADLGDDGDLIAKLRGFATAMREYKPSMVSAGYGGFAFGPADYEDIADRLILYREALAPFAACVDQIADAEDDEEWAKFRLLIKDYRRAAKALAGKRKGFERCRTCGGEFDEGEWRAASECPECETSK